MGVLNVTPDSFSDRGKYFEPDAAVTRGVELAKSGADVIDIGGESTRPGAEPVGVEEELRRVVPVVERLASEVDAALSIDTTKSEVAEAALDAGAVIVNDVSGMRFDPAMPEVVASYGAGLVLMHMQGEPRTMQDKPHYQDVVSEISDELNEWAARAEASGILRESIAVDPGIGFGKRLEDNLEILRRLHELFDNCPYPLVLGASRKSFIGAVLDRDLAERMMGTAAVTAWAAAAGVNLVRVHDVLEMGDVVRMTQAIVGRR